MHFSTLMPLRTLIIVCAGLVLIGCITFVSRTASHRGFLYNPLEEAAQFAEISTTSRQTLAASASAGELDLPILVYHIVRPSDTADSRAVRDIALTPEHFDAEMQYLKTAGYTVVRLADLEAYYKQGAPLPLHPIIITFDDGWSDQFVYAFPILKKYNYPATFFIFTNSINRPGFLSLDNLKEMIAAGITIGDHTRSHPYLTKDMDENKLWDEIYDSKLLLEKMLGVPVHEFAYPFGQYTPAILELVVKAGYRSARGDFYSGEQSADRLYELSAMNAPTTIELFKKKFPPQ